MTHHLALSIYQSNLNPDLWNCTYVITLGDDRIDSGTETLPPHQVLFFITSAHMKLESLSGVLLHFEPPAPGDIQENYRPTDNGDTP